MVSDRKPSGQQVRRIEVWTCPTLPLSLQSPLHHDLRTTLLNNLVEPRRHVFVHNPFRLK